MIYQRYDGQNGVWYTADFSGDGDRTARITVVDFVEPTATASTSNAGCEASDFTGFPAGNIALIQRGTCDFGLKVENAKAAGAAGVVLFNEGTIGAPDRNDVLIPTLEGYDATGVPSSAPTTRPAVRWSTWPPPARLRSASRSTGSSTRTS